MTENDEKNYSPIMLGTADTARVLGITPRRLQQLVKEDIITKENYGKYEMTKVVPAYLQFRISQIECTDEEDLNLKKEKTLLTRAQRKKAEMELAVMKGELHKAEDVERVMNTMLSAFRNRCWTIPSRASPILVNKNLNDIKLALRAEISEALQELSDPKIKGVSRIEQDFEKSDKRKFFLPCSHCGHMHILEWRNLYIPKDEKGKYITAKTYMNCPECGCIIEEHHKTAMLAGGEWCPCNRCTQY